MPSNRIGRINEEIQRELAALIPTVKDPRVTGMISVTAVETTSDLDVELPGQGVFMEALCRALARRGIALPCVGVKAGPQATARVKALLAGQIE